MAGDEAVMENDIPVERDLENMRIGGRSRSQKTEAHRLLGNGQPICLVGTVFVGPDLITVLVGDFGRLTIELPELGRGCDTITNGAVDIRCRHTLQGGIAR